MRIDEHVYNFTKILVGSKHKNPIIDEIQMILQSNSLLKKKQLLMRLLSNMLF